jgi:hypothetical protein
LKLAKRFERPESIAPCVVLEPMMSHDLQIASAVFAIVAAVLFVRTPKEFSIRVSVSNAPSHLATSAYSPAYGESDELNALGKALIRQSRLSAAAAASAALAAFAQVLAVLTA